MALAGLMMRSLQMATRLRHAFDPSAGYAAGATLVQRGHTVAQSCPAGSTLHWLLITPLTLQARRLLFEARVDQPC